MKFCTVCLDPDLSEEQEREIVRSIKNFRGIRSVELSQVLISAETDDSGAIYRAETTSKNASAASPHRARRDGAISSESTTPPLSRSGNLEEMTGRHTINQAIKWAINNRYMTLDELSMLSPGQLVEKAMSILDIMPKEEKANLGKEISDLNAS